MSAPGKAAQQDGPFCLPPNRIDKPHGQLVDFLVMLVARRRRVNWGDGFYNSSDLEQDLKGLFRDAPVGRSNTLVLSRSYQSALLRSDAVHSEGSEANTRSCLLGDPSKRFKCTPEHRR
ncbi:hypothetical protein CC1G_15785 [Coprinopsis cinerea okayama7|uniref:Uncharacterized protein n=1 Tax=Coprinopsis cinerea (strain Okayama-7 / 130 / ATCC MYA-4618 / FGSC 9003) TaxID=240176 RepID=D6RQY8_COPC7|nr:hypothetical protein CC1G_15785 [Coprinopsis cinerea okayama7\|eukprot:XP_002910065.1 hypothetical protein CC1G_15785 [Coprinopsis cinerea okayama7\